MNNLVDLSKSSILIAGVGLTEGSGIGIDTSENGGAMGHLVMTAFVDPIERDADLFGLDCGDLQGNQPPMSAVELSLPQSFPA